MNIEHKKEIIAKLLKCEDVGDVNLHFEQLRKLGDSLLKNEDIENLIKFINALANKKRLMIMNILKEKDRCVCELETALDDSQPSISHHLRILENAGLIRGWKKGKFTHYDIINNQLKKYLKIINEELG